MIKRGWCPSLYEPMASGDGLLVRVKPPLGIIPAAAAHVLAGAAERFGNGIVSLTNRANLQFRGLSEQGAKAFADVVLALGLASTDPLAERRRNVIVSPLNVTAGVLSQELEAVLLEPSFAGLPGKFGIVVDAGPYSVAKAPGDILLLVGRDEVQLIVGNMSAATGQPVSTVRKMIAAMLGMGSLRMRDVPPIDMFTAAGLKATRQLATFTQSSLIGPLEGAFGVGLAFGHTDAAGLRSLASLAGSGDGTLRLTPWRTVLLPGIDQAPTDHKDLITDPASPLLGINTCPGRPYCAQASVNTYSDARALAGLVLHLHISGCEKGCAHPGAAAVTLIGRNGHYDIVRHGSTHDIPIRSDLTVTEIANYIRVEQLT